MHFKDILYSVLPLLAVTNANAAAIEAQQDLEARRVSKLVMRQVPVLPCSHLSNGVHVIAASGDGANNIGGYGLLGNLSMSILKAIPGSSNVTLPYPKDSSTPVVYKTTQGSKNMLQYITDYHHYCPNTKIVLLGYSSGAMIMGDTLCGASPNTGNPAWAPTAPLSTVTYGNTVIAAIGYGDEKHDANTAYNKGTCMNTNGRFPRTGASAACTEWASRYQSYCDGDDPQCCMGFNVNVHFQYDMKYDQVATQFVVNQANKFGK